MGAAVLALRLPEPIQLCHVPSALPFPLRVLAGPVGSSCHHHRDPNLEGLMRQDSGGGSAGVSGWSCTRLQTHR